MSTEHASTYHVSGKLWIYPGESANWHFLTIPKRESGELRERYRGLAKGFGSLPVTVSIGATTWKTSIFPDRKSGTYLLPIKAEVRRREGLFEGERCAISLSVKL